MVPDEVQCSYQCKFTNQYHAIAIGICSHHIWEALLCTRSADKYSVHSRVLDVVLPITPSPPFLADVVASASPTLGSPLIRPGFMRVQHS